MARYSEKSASQRQGRSLRVITGSVLVGIALVLVVENRGLVDIRVLVPVVTMPLWTALAAMLLIGVVIGFLSGRHGGNRQR